MAKFITDLGPDSPIARYAVWRLNTSYLLKNKSYSGSNGQVIEISDNLDELAALHGLDASKVIKLYEEMS